VLAIGDEQLSEALGEAECRRLLATAGIGRLGFTRGALPEVRPVSFFLREDDVVLPAREGSAALEALTGTVVVLAVDSWAQVGRSADDAGGWSVSVVGPVRLDAGGTGPASTGDLCRLRLRPGIVRGWRIRPCPVGPPGG
jgi:hypothetical protein